MYRHILRNVRFPQVHRRPAGCRRFHPLRRDPRCRRPRRHLPLLPRSLDRQQRRHPMIRHCCPTFRLLQRLRDQRRHRIRPNRWFPRSLRCSRRHSLPIHRPRALLPYRFLAWHRHRRFHRASLHFRTVHCRCRCSSRRPLPALIHLPPRRQSRHRRLRRDRPARRRPSHPRDRRHLAGEVPIDHTPRASPHPTAARR